LGRIGTVRQTILAMGDDVLTDGVEGNRKAGDRERNSADGSRHIRAIPSRIDPRRGAGSRVPALIRYPHGLNDIPPPSRVQQPHRHSLARGGRFANEPESLSRSKDREPRHCSGWTVPTRQGTRFVWGPEGADSSHRPAFLLRGVTVGRGAKNHQIQWSCGSCLGAVRSRKGNGRSDHRAGR
jgi:hypothetical protein